MPPIIAPPHPFDAATALTPAQEGTFLGRTSAEYANMVGPFGGITAATLLRAVLGHPRRLGDPVSITVNFASPIGDGAFEVAAEAVRTNRSTQHWTIVLRQDEEIKTTATAVFGIRRAGWSDTETPAPSVPSAESIAPQAVPEGIAWFRNYEMRFVAGGVDALASGPAADSRSTLWVRDLPARPLDFPALTALADVFMPRVMLRLGRLLPAGTISLTVYFHAGTGQLTVQGDRPLLGTAHAHRFGDGYFDQTGHLWGEDGSLLATTHQMVYFKS